MPFNANSMCENVEVASELEDNCFQNFSFGEVLR